MTQWQPSLILVGKDRNVSVLKDKCFEEILYVPKHLKQPWTSEHGFRVFFYASITGEIFHTGEAINQNI